MTATDQHSVVHNTFCIERVLRRLARAHFFEPLPISESKMKWFSGPAEWITHKRDSIFGLVGARC